MIPSPYRFETKFSDQELQTLGRFALRWSTIEHTIANCLRVMLRMEPKPATVMVFPLSLYDRMDRIGKIDKMQPMSAESKALFLELKPPVFAMQYIRNAAIHGVLVDFLADEPFWHLRSKDRAVSKSELFSCEELINYTAHVRRHS